MPFPRFLEVICCEYVLKIEDVKEGLIIHYRRLYLDRPDPIDFLSLALNTTGRLYDDFIRLLFLHVHREASAWTINCGRSRIAFDFFALPAGLI